MGIKKIVKGFLFLSEYAAHKKLGITYYQPTKEEFERLKTSLIEDYFSSFSKQFPSHDRKETEKGFSWMDDHLRLRLDAFREKYVPFLNSVRKLKGSNVLDVGCGTGASLVALAEAGANVYGLDIDQPSLNVAKVRCDIYKIKTDISLAAAPDIESFRPGVKFDYIIFNASLEHMYLTERLASLKAAWNRLSPGGHMAVIECPNRLWYFDYHTSQLPFFEWLPHDLALMYTRFSPRKYINELYNQPDTQSTMEQFIRIGRGMSYHEIDIAIGNNAELGIAGNMSDFVYAENNWLDKYRIRKKTDFAFQKFLQEKSGFALHKAYCEPWLNFVIQKK